MAPFAPHAAGASSVWIGPGFRTAQSLAGAALGSVHANDIVIAKRQRTESVGDRGTADDRRSCVSRSTATTLAPFAIVFVLAVAIATAAVFASRPASTVTSAPVTASAARPASALPTASVPSAAAAPSATSAPATARPVDARSDAAAMLSVHNELRTAVGAPALRVDDRVVAAAQHHAEYLARNNTIGHEEAADAAGFTGVTVRDRLAAQGYAGTTVSEVATSFGSGVDGVRSLWLLPYHRLGLMHPHAIVAGWGHAEVGGRSTTVGVIVYDFGAPASDVVRSPADGERVQPSWDGEESPDVLPTGAARPVGYPVMLVASEAKTVELRAARLTDASGREVAYHVVPQIYERDYVAIVPAQPLARDARYRVRMELSVGGTDRVEEWEFRTGP